MERFDGSLINIGASHHTAPIDIREKLSVSPERLADAYRELQGLPGVRETTILSTCNRTELLAVLENGFDPRLLAHSFCNFQNLFHDALAVYGYERRDIQAVNHVFGVAAGLDSLVVGETEILGQVKNAYAEAVDYGAIGPFLNRLFQKTFQAAKWVRANTSIGCGQVSVGSVAVDLALKIFGDLGNCRILVIGAGEISERALVALKSRGATSLTICNRTNERAMELAEEFEASALPYAQFPAAIGRFDIVVCSTSSPTPIVVRDSLREIMKTRGYGPLFLIDLAVPRDGDPGAGELENVFLYNIDDLSRIAAQNLESRRAEMKRCRDILSRRAEHFWKAAVNREVQPK